MNASVLTYALWRNDDQPRSSTLLAVGVKSAVLLYESPKGERAFRFIKVSRTSMARIKIDEKSAFFPLFRNSTRPFPLAASCLFTKVSKKTSLGAFRMPLGSCVPRLRKHPDEGLAIACASGRQRSRSLCSTPN
jgi:hypothetical protein